ncbi:DUF550 domain-containing protein [Escherichia coli]|nr:DUF550 domain-containing protein [Escherichia coli]MCX1564449.1 DUF550 domain-containing protein [Escherichia coli]MCX1574360.1 DUF550 domain-containing protein [Escherichia coli]MCX1652006.1 DUF550 domain-containing protein [Escherichia coli]
MTTITKERLLTIKQWRETYGPGSNVVLPAEEAEELARIALASLEAEPVLYMNRFTGKTFSLEGQPGADKEPEIYVPLYAAPPAPVVPDKLPREHMGRQPCHQITASMAKSIALKLGAELNNEEAEIFADGYNAAVLHGAKPVSQTYKLNKLSGNSPVTPDGWVMVPKKLTAENGAKGVLSGEFSETTFISCPECFGDDDCDTCDGSGRIEIKVPVTWTTIKSIWDKGIAHFAAKPPQEVNRG